MSSIPRERVRCFAIIAHIDHGKSTLADRLIELTGTVAERDRVDQMTDGMDLERERGITIKAQTVRMIYRAKDGLDYLLNLIDTPGHVDFHYEVSRSLAACEGAILVVDAAQGVEAQTVANAELAVAAGLEILPVVNKIDLPSADPERALREVEDIVGISAEGALRVSAKTGQGVAAILEAIVARRAGAEGRPRGAAAGADLRQLVRLLHGRDHAGAAGRRQAREARASQLLSDKSEWDVTLLGVPQIRVNRIDVGLGRRGRGRRRRASATPRRCGSATRSPTPRVRPPSPLPGFKPMQPMVWSGLYPADPGSYDALRAAIDKLQLNDSSFTAEPETSGALGFGFRCGYLGLLHMEIAQERLEREFGLDLIITAPTVVYQVKKTDGDMIELHRPSDLPDLNDDRGDPGATHHGPDPHAHAVPRSRAAALPGAPRRAARPGRAQRPPRGDPLRPAAGRGRGRLLRQAEVGEPRLRVDELRSDRLQGRDAGEARRAGERRSRRRALDHHARATTPTTAAWRWSRA